MSELKPCPFCGGDSRMVSGPCFASDAYVFCKGCRAEGPTAQLEDDAVAAWNTRPGEEALRQERDKEPLEPCCVQCFCGLSDDEQEGAYVAACNVCGKELE